MGDIMSALARLAAVVFFVVVAGMLEASSIYSAIVL
jgi:hypothetical protein